MRHFCMLLALVAVIGFGEGSTRAEPPEQIVDTMAAGNLKVVALARIEGVGTLRSVLVGEAGVRCRSEIPGGENFPSLPIPFVLFAAPAEDAMATVRLGRSSFEDPGTGFIGALVLNSLTDTRAGVRDELLLLQRLPFFDGQDPGSGPDISLADTIVNAALLTPSPEEGALDEMDPLALLLDDLTDGFHVTQARAFGVLRGIRGNSVYRGVWVIRFAGTVPGDGDLAGRNVRGVVKILFGSTEEPTPFTSD